MLIGKGLLQNAGICNVLCNVVPCLQQKSIRVWMLGVLIEAMTMHRGVQPLIITFGYNQNCRVHFYTAVKRTYFKSDALIDDDCFASLT